jgi:PelA/Pel-15E family pectate lyase
MRSFFHSFAPWLALATTTWIAAAPAPRPWGPDPFAPLTLARINALPAEVRAPWLAYWETSQRETARLAVRPQADQSSLKPMSTPPKGGLHSKGLRLSEPLSYYQNDSAKAVADRIVEAQSPVGGWTKGVDYSQPSTVSVGRQGAPMFDNDATTAELRFLAQVISAHPTDAHRKTWTDAFDRGLGYIFSAQYPNGGFPQIYPLAGGYHDGVTYNDDAMTQVLEVLRDVSAGKSPYGDVSAERRAESGKRFQRGIECVLATQLKNKKGELTVWCQQYDPLTLKASAARNFEPIADSSRESAGLVVLLMSLPEPSPRVVAAVEGAAAWFNDTALHDLKIARAPADRRGRAVPSPGAPPLWARYYEPGTNTPIFGDRDRTIHYDLSEISSERIAGYAWYTDMPSRVLTKFEAWKKKWSVAAVR